MAAGRSYGRYSLMRKESAKTADYTVVNNDNGTLFTNAGAVGAINFTLPAITTKKRFGFRVIANQNVTVTSAEGDNIVVVNDAAADSVAFSTANEKIGGIVYLESNAAGTLWFVDKPCSNTLTVAT